MQLKLKNGVGASRDSDPKDVIKAKTVLNALGELKPDAELGLNGFVDRPFDAGVRRFQKRRGLLVTGEIKPGDETEEAINAELRQMGRKPRRARRSSTRDVRSAGKQTGVELDSSTDGLGTADSRPLAGRQTLAQASEEPAREKNGPRGSQIVPPVPAYRREVFKTEEWRDWFGAARKLPNVSSAELKAYLEIFAAEGGARDDPTSSASSGILQSTLDRAVDRGRVPMTKDRRLTPTDLSLNQRAAVYRAYFDDVLATVDRSVPGSRVLRRVGNDEAAAAFADTMFRHGRGGGARLTQQAINAVRPGTVPEDGRMGPGTFRAFRQLAQSPEERRALLNALADARNRATNNAEKGRMDHFRFQNSM